MIFRNIQIMNLSIFFYFYRIKVKYIIKLNMVKKKNNCLRMLRMEQNKKVIVKWQGEKFELDVLEVYFLRIFFRLSGILFMER